MLYDENDGRWHMWASVIADHCGMEVWFRNSKVVHATSESQCTGGFTQLECISHNACLQRGLFERLQNLGSGRCCRQAIQQSLQLRLRIVRAVHHEAAVAVLNICRLQERLDTGRRLQSKGDASRVRAGDRNLCARGDAPAVQQRPAADGPTRW